MVDELKSAIDVRDYYNVRSLAYKDPLSFFTCFNVRKARILGKKRLEWLRTTAEAHSMSDEKSAFPFNDFDNLLLRAIELTEL